jgi:hypothetical protein
MTLSPEEIRRFIDEVTGTSGERFADEIVARWLADRQDAADEARDAIYDDARDSWNGGEGA